MVSAFTPNVQIEQPARGDDPGTWDTPVNNNMSLIDLLAGGITTISGAAGSVVLSAAQFRSKTITFNSTLTASITVTFPTSFLKSYEIRNLCTGSSQGFVITLGTTATSGQVICCPPGESVNAVNDGTNLYFHNLERVGSYWDYAGSSIPTWVSGCTVAPYLNCDGTTFNSSVYPQLAVILGSTILPDSRGRTRGVLNQGTGRMTAGNGGVDGNTRGAVGGADSVTLITNQIPAHSHGVTDPGHAHGGVIAGADAVTVGSQTPSGNPQYGGANTNTSNGPTNISINNAGGGASHINMQPTYVGGLTLIRAA